MAVKALAGERRRSAAFMRVRDAGHVVPHRELWRFQGHTPCSFTPPDVDESSLWARDLP